MLEGLYYTVHNGRRTVIVRSEFVRPAHCILTESYLISTLQEEISKMLFEEAGFGENIFKADQFKILQPYKGCVGKWAKLELIKKNEYERIKKLSE